MKVTVKRIEKVARASRSQNLISYEEVLKNIPGTKHLLLGNGFSIGCDPIFAYPNLFDFACKNGLNDHVQQVFHHFGTNNFEGIMRLLDDGIWMTQHYSMIQSDQNVSSMSQDLESIKRALIKALTLTHLPDTSKLSDKKKDSCVSFLEPFFNIFTTNYDLLLYWVSLHGQASLKKMDGFDEPLNNPSADYVVWEHHLGPNKGIFFIHGALHLYIEDGQVCKHSWTRKNISLIKLIKEGLQRNQYPLFVAEGTSDKKRQQIARNDYLSYCLEKFERIQHNLVVYGHSFGQSDAHIISAIGQNPKLENVYIGLYSEPNTPSSKAVMAAVNEAVVIRNNLKAKRPTTKKLSLHFYDSKSAKVWS